MIVAARRSRRKSTVLEPVTVPLITRGSGSATNVNALKALALASTTLHPDDLPRVVQEVSARHGFADVTIYLSDLDQRALTPLRSPQMPSLDALLIDDSEGGRAYRTEQPVIVGAPDRSTVWLPLMDSAERVGVVSMTLSPASPDAIEDATALVNFVGELVQNKAQHGDSIERARRTQEMTLSAELRWAMLPPLTFTGRNVTITGILEPAYDIAGDTFDYAVNGNVAHLAVIDAVGHGLEAARIANLAVGSYRQSRRRDGELAETYFAIDAAIGDQFDIDKFVALQLATLALDTGTLRWINGGIPDPIRLRGGTCTDLTAEISLPAGLRAVAPDHVPSISETTLEPGDSVLFATDGVIEARDRDGAEFGRGRLGEFLLRAAAEQQTPAETLRLLGHAVLAHQEYRLQDDATLLLVHWRGGEA